MTLRPRSPFDRRPNERLDDSRHYTEIHSQLGISLGKPIPRAWLEVLLKANIGDRVDNPTTVGFDNVEVTPRLKRLAKTEAAIRGYDVSGVSRHLGGLNPDDVSRAYLGPS